LMERLKELMEEQDEEHSGGNKWIGTGGTSPFGNSGYNPEGVRMGGEGGGRSAVKVWDERNFKNLDDKVELNTRNFKMALKRLRVFTREGVLDELDIDTTIRKTSDNGGMIDIHMVPSKRNRVKVLLLMDVGGSMDDHVKICSQLFSAAKYEFKNIESYYFHNCVYESLWKDNNMRWQERIPTLEIINKYNKDYKVIFIGDAAMAPYELLYTRGSIEGFNDESGISWLNKFVEYYPNIVWINPNPAHSWDYFETTQRIRELFNKRMFPMSPYSISKAMKCLKDKKIQFKMAGE